jgi:hypothetical protein
LLPVAAAAVVFELAAAEVVCEPAAAAVVFEPAAAVLVFLPLLPTLFKLLAPVTTPEVAAAPLRAVTVTV